MHIHVCSLLHKRKCLCALAGGGVNGGSQVCGAMTSGGTESILSAVKASRDYMCSRCGITAPEMVIGESAHAAFFKAAEYFKIRLIKVWLTVNVVLLQNGLVKVCFGLCTLMTLDGACVRACSLQHVSATF